MGTLSKSFTDMTLKERLEAIKSRPALVIDISSSMNGDVEPGRTKYEAVQSILERIDTGTILAFNDSVRQVTKNTLPQPTGGTSLSPVFLEMKKRGIQKAVVITDGEVNFYDQEESLKNVEGLEIKVLYVGPGGKPEFLDKLARASGGFCDEEDLKSDHQGELEGKIQKLLGSGNSGPSTINL